jgi:hypothetical protein
MRTIGLGLALAASAQLMLLSSPAMADDTKSTTGFEASQPAPRKDSSKAMTGWIVLGGGGALALGGIIVDAIGAGKNNVSGQGGAGDTATTQGAKYDLLFAGTTMIVLGVVAGIYGGSLVLEAKRASQDADLARTAPPPALGSADPVTKAAQASLAGAPTVVVPVLGARF